MIYLHSQVSNSQSMIEENEVNNSHISALRMKHAELETKLAQEENRPFPDSKMILNIKKQKLHLKDIMSFEAVGT
jgi:uncharacterized protein